MDRSGWATFGLIATVSLTMIMAVALQSDVTEQSSVGELIDQTLAKLGTIEVLVHLVGGWAGRSAAEHLSSDLGAHVGCEPAVGVLVQRCSASGHARPGLGPARVRLG